MQQPIRIVFRGMEPSPAVESRIQELALHLERFDQHITRCQVTVQAPHQHHHQGQLYDVRIQVRVPGRELAVSREGSQNHAHEDVYVALRDAFEAAGRRLDEYVERRERRSRVSEAS